MCCARSCRLAPQLRNGPVKPTTPAKHKQRHERETCIPDCACNRRLQNCSTSHVQLTADGKVQQTIAQTSNCSGISCKRTLLEGGTSYRGMPLASLSACATCHESPLGAALGLNLGAMTICCSHLNGNQRHITTSRLHLGADFKCCRRQSCKPKRLINCATQRRQNNKHKRFEWGNYL